MIFTRLNFVYIFTAISIKLYHFLHVLSNRVYIEATVDRVKSCVERDKNRPCVVIWFMGNECAYGCTFEEALKWAKAHDNTRLTHFESARYHSDKRKYDFSNLDLFSRMYPPFHEILMCGGFVWEWCDHAIAHGKSEDGRVRYITDLSIDPAASKSVILPISIPKKGNTFLKTSYYTKKEYGVIKEGTCLGFDEIALKNEDDRNQKVVALYERAENERKEFSVEETDAFVSVRGEEFHYILDKRTGLFTHLTYQENGSHYDCSVLQISGEKNGITAYSEKKFSFNTSIYMQEELTAKKHNFELVPSGYTVCCLDYAQSGIGSNSCGPELLNSYRLHEKEFEFCIRIAPFIK